MRHVTMGALSLLGTDNEKPDSRGDCVGIVARIRFTSEAPRALHKGRERKLGAKG